MAKGIIIAQHWTVFGRELLAIISILARLDKTWLLILLPAPLLFSFWFSFLFASSFSGPEIVVKKWQYSVILSLLDTDRQHLAVATCEQ